MKKLNLLVTAVALSVAPTAMAETLAIDGNTWDVNKSTTQLASGVKLHKITWNTIRSSSYPSGSLVHIIEADLSDPTVGIEVITNGLTGTKTLANHAPNAKTGTAIAGANGNFWITSPEKANYACMGTQPHGVEVSNGTMYTEPNVRDFAHCGGPVDWTGMFVYDNDGKAYMDFIKPTIDDSAPGSGFEFNALVVEKGWRFGLNKCNRWCSSGSASIFTKEYGTSKAFRTGDLSGDTYTTVNGGATEILLDFAPGQNGWNIGGVTKFVIKEIRQNAGGGTLGAHDCAIVGRDSYATVANQQCAVGQTIEISTKINFKSQGTPNGIAQAFSGNVQAMKDGVITDALTQQNATGTYNTGYNERTLYGLSADGKKFYIITCEHKPAQQSTYFGFSTKQLALILKQYGAAHAIQVDCGGSAQMWTKSGGLISRSYDSSGVRSVHNGVFIVTKSNAPTITSDCANTSFGSVAVSQSATKSFTVSGNNLSGNISLALSGANANQFSVSPASIAGSGSFTVTYKPTATGSHTATLTLSATGAPSLTYTLSGTAVEKLNASSIDMTNTYADLAISELSGKTVKRVVAKGNYLYILAHSGTTPYLYVYDHQNKKVLRQLGTTNCVGDILTLSDIDMADDNVLIGIAKVNQVFQGTGKVLIYRWNPDTNGVPSGEAVQWNVSNNSGNFNNGVCGESMCYNGTTSNGHLYYTAVTAATANGAMRIVHLLINSSGQLGGAQHSATVFNESTLGTYLLHKSTNNTSKFIINGTSKGAVEYTHPQTAAGTLTASNPISCTGIDNTAYATGTLAYGGYHYMTSPTATGVTMANITNGVGSAVPVTINSTAISSKEVKSAMTSGTTETYNGNPYLALFSLRGNQLSKFSTNPVVNTDPTLSSNCTDVTFSQIVEGETATKTYGVNGTNLTADIKLAISGTNAAMFSVSPASLSASGNFTITYKPTAAGSHTATLKITSTGANTLTYTLTGSAAEYIDPATVGDRANYAYSLTQTGDKASGYTLSYKLTGDVKSAHVVLTDKAGKTLTLDGGTARGLNTVHVSLDELDTEAAYSWKVVVNSKPVIEDACFFSEAPTTLGVSGGVGVVTDPESNAYGRVITSVGKAQGFGLYEPDMTKVGQYLAGNSPWDATNNYSTARLGMRDRKVAYVTDFSATGAGIWAFNPEHPEYGTSNIIGGTNDGSGCFKLADGTFVGSNARGIGFEGEGANTRMWVFTRQWPNSDNTDYKGILCRWDIGNDQKVEKFVNAAYGQYTGTSVFLNQNVNIVPSSHGVFVTQVRGENNNVKSCPGFILTNIYGTELYNSGNDASVMPSCGGGLALSADEKLLAVSGGKLNTRLYSIAWDGDKPTLTYIREIEGTATDNIEISQMAFDPAGNLLCWQLSTNKAYNGLRAYALENDNPVAETPAKAAMIVYGPEAGQVTPAGKPITAADVTEAWEYSLNKGNLSKIKDFTIASGHTRDMCVIGTEMYLLHIADHSNTRTPSIARHWAYNPEVYMGDVNISGVTGGTFPIAGIKSLGKTLVACNMVGAAEALKIYKWSDVTKAPECILNSTNHGGIAVGRSFMTSGDENNGRIAFACSGTSKIVYYQMTDGTLNATPVVINLTNADGTAYSLGGNNSNQDVSFMEDGSFWIFNKDTHPVHFDANGKLITTLTATHMGSGSKLYGQGGQAFKYDGNNYVAATSTLGSTNNSAWGNVTMSLVDLSEGSAKAKHIGKYPAAGLGDANWASSAGNNAVEYQVEGDNEGLNLWVLSPEQGLARYSVGKVTTGVEDIKVAEDDEEVAPVYYNLNGVRIAADRLTPGLYIRVRGNKSDKVVIR